jgi:hypothetical protein
MNEQVKKILPPGLTTYDIFKCAAVLLMVVDHIGFFFFPDELWLRVAGRLCVPVWMFLVGYARSRDMGPQMWIAVAILSATNIVAGMYVFPFCILLTILITRMVMDPMMERMLRSRQVFWSMNAILFALAIPTMMATEYGTHAIIMAVFGYMARRMQDGDPRIGRDLLSHHMAFTAITYIAIQYVLFGFAQPQALALCVGTLAVCFALLMFRPGVVPGTGSGVGAVLSWPVKVVGRHTLLIYVAHLVAFKGLAMWVNPEKYGFMNWHWLIQK